MSKEFAGVYRGTVRNTVDPLQRARLQVSVPNVPTASELAWASPCVPFGGEDGIGAFSLPPVGANVWVMFENGSPEFPIWLGTFWGADDQPPAQPAVERTRIFKCESLTVKLTDVPGAALLEISLSTGPKLTLGPTGIVIDNGFGATIKLEGPQVSVNNGALEVL